MQFWQLSTAKIEIQRDARTIISTISRHLMQATTSSVIIDRYNSNQPPYSRISFTKVDKTFTYYQEGQKLYEVIGSTRCLAKSVVILYFAYPETRDDSIINISLTMEKKIMLGSKTSQFLTQKVKTRIMN
ncbi:MAG: hypothetical protein ABID79_04830 [Elusimicrobiota bacterium]